MKGLFSGRQIKDLKGRSQAITRSQTAAQAYAAIMGKYGSIQDNAHYFHRGKGEWHKYSLEGDRTRTGKLAASKGEWVERPNKFDWLGIDTKAEGAARKKRNFSVSKLKPAAPVGRKTPLTGKLNGIKVNRLQRARRVVKGGYNFREGFTWINNGRTYKIVSITGTGNNKNIKYVNVAKPDKKYVTSEKDLNFGMQMDKEIRKVNNEMAAREEEFAKKEAEHKKKLDEEYKKQISGLESFELTVPVIRRPKLIEALNRLIRHDGRILSSKELIREKLKAGWRVEQQTWTTYRKINGEHIGTKHTGKVIARGNESLGYPKKTDIDFAEYLTKKLGVSP